MKKEYMTVVREMLNDKELLCGGIFSKEKYYMEKYNITQHQMDEMSIHVYFALNIDTHENRIN